MIRGVCSHVLIHNSKYFGVALDVVLHNCTSAQETTFLTGVEVELESILWGVLGCGKDTQRLEYSDDSL